MQFDENNKVIKLCAQGMALEATGKQGEAAALFLQAWGEASDNFEKFTAAHYVARHQSSVQDKLQWDKTALEFALQVHDESMKAHYPSLYLNIAKCYEDMHDTAHALEHYRLAQNFTTFLQDDGYGNMIRAGIDNGIERVRR